MSHPIGTCRYGHGNMPNLPDWAYRLMLSRLDPSYDANLITREIGDCPGCWQQIAVYVAALASEYLTATCDDDEAEAIATIQDRLLGI